MKRKCSDSCLTGTWPQISPHTTKENTRRRKEKKPASPPEQAAPRCRRSAQDHLRGEPGPKTRSATPTTVPALAAASAAPPPPLSSGSSQGSPEGTEVMGFTEPGWAVRIQAPLTSWHRWLPGPCSSRPPPGWPEVSQHLEFVKTVPPPTKN